mmetsp:Transcript_9954/g.15349  ORF Transcript_9954/g.15349 Transcript_9954/m.15349 type:complete len:511 (-) Transcript_9954:41-1573(-)
MSDPQSYAVPDVQQFPSAVAPNANAATENKWSKNGFGEPCPRGGGKFTRDETELVRAAVEEYCALKNISTARLCSECDHKAELKGAWMEIAKRLPHRTVQSVYRHGLRQLHPFKRGPWSESECHTLIELVQRHGKKWSAIQAKLNRSADSCRDKYREMSSDYVKGRWKEGETEILKRLIREHLRADPNADIKELGRMVENEGIVIPWSSISKRMGKRSRLSCFKKWQKMTGIFSPSDQHKQLSPVTTIPAPVQVQQQQQAPVQAQASAPPPVAVSNPEQQDQKPTGVLAPHEAESAAATATAALALGADPNHAQAQQVPVSAMDAASAAHNAPTAGAAAAAAAAAAKHVANPVLDMLATAPTQPETTTAASGTEMSGNPTENAAGGSASMETIREYDLYLLQNLQTSGATSSADVDWASLPRHVLGDPQERFNMLLDEFEDLDEDPSFAHLSLSEIAKHMFERKQEEGDAKTAAETVEAIDLPAVPGICTTSSTAEPTASSISTKKEFAV